jgi:RNA polymerase sigma factor (sigma-70 family)
MTRTDTHLSDEEIIRKILSSGSNKMFEVLWLRYSKKVKDKCYSLIKDHHLAEEFTVEIFSKVMEKLDGYKGISSFSTWLYAITYNHCIEYLRLKKRLHYPEWNRKNELPDVVDEIEEDVTEIRYDRMMKILDMIHPEEKTLLLMKYKDNAPLKLIQATLKISESAAKMRIKRAKARVSYLYKRLYATG